MLVRLGRGIFKEKLNIEGSYKNIILSLLEKFLPRHTHSHIHTHKDTRETKTCLAY